MADLAPVSPLMALIHYHGQDYYSAQYFHRQYLANSPHGGKYQRFDSFMRQLHGMETFHDYVASGDIILLAWNDTNALTTKSCSVNKDTAFKHLFLASGYHAITLINATAQVELTHHLDDEVSRRMAMASSRLAARQMTRKATGSILPEEHADRAYTALCNIGRQMGTPLYIVQQEAVKLIAHTTGIDLTPFLLAAPAQDHIPDDDVMLEPTDLAKALNVASGRDMNLWLQSWGWQIRNIADGWEPTPAGLPFCSRHAWVRGSKSGFNLKWKRLAVETMLTQHAKTQQP